MVGAAPARRASAQGLLGWGGKDKNRLEIGQTDLLCGAMAEEEKNLIFFVVAIRIKGNSSM